MPGILDHIDFLPRLLDERSCYSTLSLSCGVPGPVFESYDSLVDKANVWLNQNPDARVVSCETLIIEGVYDLLDNDSLAPPDSWERKYPAFLTMLRLWVRTGGELSDSATSVRATQIGYRDVLPARQETNPDAFGPKYESLSDALKRFNHSVSQGEEDLPGKVISMETCTCRFTTRNCGVDPTKTFWMMQRKSDLHRYNFFRIFFTIGTPKACELGFMDFSPQYTGNPRKNVKAENFVHLTRRAEQWCQSATRRMRLLNVQTVDHNTFFKCYRDAIGHEKKVLDNPHFVETQGDNVYHTKILRLYYVKRASSESSPASHILHKTFHIPAALSPQTSRIDNAPETLLPKDVFDDVMCRIRRWIAIKGVKVMGVETVKLVTHQGQSMISAEDTHFESSGLKNLCVVHAIRLYIQDEAGSLSKKDLNPEPKHVKLLDHHCIVL